MPNNPTVILGSLNDEELKKSIDNLVTHVDTQLDHMVSSAKKAVKDINTVFKSLGDIKVDSGGTSDGGSSRRAKSNDKETTSIKEKTEALNQQIDALQRTAKAGKDVANTYDQQAQAMQKATQGNDLIKVFDEKGLVRLKNELRETQVEYKKLGEDGAASARATELANKINELTAKVNQYELALKNMASAQRAGGMSFDIKGWVKDIDAKDVRLKQLKDWYSELERQAVSRGISESRVTEEIRRQAEAIRNTREWQERGHVVVGDVNYYDPERANVSKREKQILLSLEEQILQATTQREEAERKAAQATKDAAEAKKAQVVGVSGQELGWGSVHDMERRSQAVMEQNKKVQEQAASYSALENVVSQYLGVSVQELQLMTQKDGSYNALSASLKNMIAAYQEMTQSERSSAAGQHLADNIQKVQRAVHEAQAQMTRPVNLEEVLGFQPKTLDEIAYKMRQLQAYRQGIDLTKPNATNEIKQVNDALKSLQKDMDSYMGKASGIIKTNTALGRSWNYMKNRLAFYFTVGAFTSFVKGLVEVRGQYELLERSIGILVDSMQQGTKVFSELNAMAIKSPFTTMELGAAAKQLVAYDVAAKDVVDTTRRLADMAAAVGIPIERLTYALGQIKAYGYLNARDARMFANAGIPLVKELADRYTELEGRLVSTSDVYDRIKKKAISYEDVMETVNKMTDEGGKFFNFQEKAADTLKVKIANLTLAYNNFLNDFGKSNQGMIAGGLGITKTLLENWRTFDNILWGVASAYGAVKAAQILFLTATRNSSMAAIFATTVSKGLVKTLISLRASLVALATNPFTWVMAAASAIAYLGWQFHDLQEANENFNKSLIENTGENIKSISKFLEDYKDQLASIGGSDTIEQQKMWERMAEEIEKTTKNAKGYLAELEKISDMPARIEAGKKILSQSQDINKEVERLAKIGTFGLGGGFANDSLAKDLQEYEKALNGLIKDYGSVANAQKKLNEGIDWTARWERFASDVHESAVELMNFTSILDKADLDSIMGTSKDDNVRLQNIREYAHIVRDNFLATEEGQKIGLEGRARLNRALDEWIAKQGVDNKLIKDKAFGEQKYTAEQIARIEKTRTAWETFFDQLSAKDREMMDYIVSTGQYGSKEFQEIWDKAVKNLEKSSNESYQAIKNQIAELRAQPDIVIRVVYQEEGKKGDAQTQAYTSRFLTPEGKGVLTPEVYKEQLEKNTEKYGRFIKKDGEDNVEWEKRLGETYRNNEKSIKRLNAQLANKNALSKASREQKEEELKQLKNEKAALEEIRKYEHFNYEKDKKDNKDYLGEALKQQIRLINEMRSSYDKLRKAGVDDTEAITVASRGYEKTVSKINTVLAKFGVKQFKPEEFAGKSYKALLESLKAQRDTLAKNGKVKLPSLESLDVEIKKLEVDAKAFDLQKVTEGLNKELDKTKDEYELAVELDAMPELGSMFADMMGLSEEDLKNLPRTYEQVVKKLQEGINKEFKDNDIAASFDLSKNLRDKDFQKWVSENALAISSDFIQKLDATRQYANKVRSDETKETVKEWKSLVEKYGTLQDKILKIYKDSIKEQQTIADKFGTKQQKSDVRSLIADIQLSDSPEEIAKLQKKVAEIVKQITDANPVALKFAMASKKGEASQVAKATWEDFKESDLYAMTFEDMSRNSTYAIQLIIDKLEQLKDKVKEDPASMKALMNSLKEARNELEGRSSTTTLISAISQWKEAQREIKATKEELQSAQDAEKTAEQNVADSATKSVQERLEAESNLAKARERVRKAQEAYAKAENKGKASNELFKASLNGLSAELGNVSGLLSSVSSLFKEAGDEDTAAAIDAINEGFAVMTTVISAVIAVMLILEAEQPVLLAIAAAMAVIVGLAKWLSGNDTEEINKKIKDSEIAVKRLENSYKRLQAEVDEAYGTMKYSAEQAAIANKKLQLQEKKRQLELERRKSSKDRDDERIESLKGEIIDLEQEIEKATKNIINDMLGINSVGDAAEQLVSSMIDAFRQGEDYMGKYAESFEDMIDNMIMKAIVSRVIGKRLEELWNSIEENAQQRGKASKIEIEAYQGMYEAYRAAAEKYQDLLDKAARNPFMIIDEEYITRLRDEANKNAQEALKKIAEAEEEYANAIAPRPDDVNSIRATVEGWKDGVQDEFEAWMAAFGISYGDKSEKNLSALQQGIQGITEDTAGALEAYMNGVSQQVYLQSDLLTQIRDAVVAFDYDVQLGTLAGILLQLQNSYTLMNSMATMMSGWTTPAGNGIRVELLS